MKILIKIEKLLFYLLVFSLPLQLRLILHSFRPQFNEWTSVYFYATDILIIAVIFLWLARIIWRRGEPDSKLRFGYIGMLLGVFLLFSGLSLVSTNNFWLSFYGFVKLVEFSAIFLYLRYNFLKLFNLEKFWQIFIAGASIQSIIAIAQFFKQKSLGLKIFSESPLGPDIPGVAKIIIEGKKIVRAYGTAPHPNILAAILILAIFGLAYLFLKNYEKLGFNKKIFFVIVFCLLSLALFLTFSRVVTITGLAFLILWLFVIWLRQKEFRKPIIIFIVLLLAISSLLAAIFWPYILARYDLGNISQTQAYNLRVFYNEVALNSIQMSPIFGIGQGNFVWTISQSGRLENWMYQPVHNIYLLVAAEVGIPGLLFFLAFLFLIIIRSHKSKGEKLGVYGLSFIVFSFLIIGLFDHFFLTLQQGQLMLWMILGILASFLGPYGSLLRPADTWLRKGK